jgi:hypothetical protein
LKYLKNVQGGVFFASICLLVNPSTTPWLAAEITPDKNERSLQPVPVYTARIHLIKVSGEVDEPIQIPIDLSPYPPPVGVFYSFVVGVLDKPEGVAPKVLAGDREISVLCSTSGTYRLRIRVNLIGKSSCGGAKANIINEQEVYLLIEG